MRIIFVSVTFKEILPYYKKNLIFFKELLKQLADTVSKGGNLLVDVGPTKEGTIPLIMQERLLQMGSWLRVNGEAVSSI